MLTWDLEENREESVFYYKTDENFKNINGRIVQGLNKKYNYFINKHEIFDIS